MTLQKVCLGIYIEMAQSCRQAHNSFIVRELGTRLVTAISIPVYAAATVPDIAIGMLLSAGSGLTLRRITDLDKKADEYLRSSWHCLPICGLLFLKVINPKARIDNDALLGIFLCSGYAALKLRKKYDHLLDSQSFWEKQVASRLLAACSAPVIAVARCVDTLMGAVFFIPCALITCGCSKTVNTVAIASVSIGGIVDDVVWSVRNTITPVRWSVPRSTLNQSPHPLFSNAFQIRGGDFCSMVSNR